MSKPQQISHSSVDTYLTCSEKYRLHYLEKLRPKTSNSNLQWGGAIDEGINELLRTKLETSPEILPTPFKSFMETWNTFEINGVKHDAKFCTLMEYSTKDLDPLLFNEFDYEEIAKYYPTVKPEQFVGEIVELRARFPWWTYDEMEESSKKAYNFLCWLSLARKADMIFQAYKDEVLPRIKRVIAIQEKVELVNDDGDTVIGYIDFIAEMDDGKVYILDNKTTSNFTHYSPDKETGLSKVKTNPQLSVYSFVKDLTHAGYVVILKEIKADGRKKGSLPKVKIKIILDEIDPDLQNKTLNLFHLTNQQIKSKVFIKKDDPKQCMSYGRKCPYFNLCWEGSEEGLVKKE